MLQLLQFADNLSDPSGFTYTTTTTTTHNSSVSIGLILGIMATILLFTLILIVIPLWKIYKKTGRPGWAAIVPLYNNYVLFEIVGYPGWWAFLSLVPFVNIFPVIISIIAYFKLAKLFGKGDGFAVCTVLFPYICLPILAFGKAQFHGSNPADTGSGPAPYSPQSPVAGDPQVGSPNPYNSPQPNQVQPSAPSQPYVQPQVVTPAGPAPQSPQAPMPPQLSQIPLPPQQPVSNPYDQQSPQPPIGPTVG